MKYQDEIMELGATVFEKSDEFQENLSEIRKGATRERTAERRLMNRGNKKVLHRRKAKKAQSTEGMETLGA